MTDAIIVLVIGAIATVGSVAFGIVILAPRITRLLDHAAPDDIGSDDTPPDDKEPGDQPD